MSDKLKTTNLRLVKFDKGNTKAFGTITFNNVLHINGLRIVSGSKGLFVSWPSRKLDDGKWRSYIFFDDEAKELREKLNNWILEQYSKGNFAQPQRKESVKTTSPPNINISDNNNDNDDDLPF